MHKEKDNAFQKGLKLEREVASIYRVLGAEVQHNVALAGNQIDILLQERTAAGTTLTTAIECKAYSGPVGVQVVNSFAALAHLLRSRGLIDRGAIVASGGFTVGARASAKEFGIDLVDIKDLQQRTSKEPQLLIKAAEEIAIQDDAAILSRPKRLFVVMPFAQEFNDVYVLGIRDVAEKLGFVVERADEIEHIESIIDIIQEKIRSCDAVIADTTSRNPNVFYEIGFANGVDRPVVLICRNSEVIPFDLQSKNFIKYASIVDLRERLEKRLRSLFIDGPGQA
jgi:hypothetical protein